MDSFDECTLIEGIRNKDNECLAKIMNHYGSLVYYIASKILNKGYENEDVKDCYNEVFTAIWFNIEYFNEEKGSFKAWLISITKYKSLNIKRRTLKYDETLEYKDEIGNSKNNDLERIDNLDYINKLLDNLEEKDKLILIKRYLEESSIEEISRYLEISKENAYTRISRAKKKIRKAIDIDSI